MEDREMQFHCKSDLADFSFYWLEILFPTHWSCTIAFFNGLDLLHIHEVHPSFLLASAVSFHTSTPTAIKQEKAKGFVMSISISLYQQALEPGRTAMGPHASAPFSFQLKLPTVKPIYLHCDEISIPELLVLPYFPRVYKLFYTNIPLICAARLPKSGLECGLFNAWAVFYCSFLQHFAQPVSFAH